MDIDEFDGQEFEPSLYGFRTPPPEIPPRPSQLALDQAANRLLARRTTRRKPAVPPRPAARRMPPQRQQDDFIVLHSDRPFAPISKQHSNIIHFTKQLCNNELFPPPIPYIEAALARLLNGNVSPNPPMREGQLWHHVISAFESQYPDPVRAERCKREVYSSWESHQATAAQVQGYLSLVLCGEPVSLPVKRMLSAPFTDQETSDQVPVFALGKVCKFACTMVFTKAMSVELDKLLVGQCTELDSLRLLRAARDCIQHFITAVWSRLVLPPAFTKQVLGDGELIATNRAGFLVRERIQFAILPVFTIGLRLFYDKVFGHKDAQVANKLRGVPSTFAALAVQFGCKSTTADRFDSKLVLELFSQALFTTRHSPIVQLNLIIQAAALFGMAGDLVVGGDDFLSLFIAGICLAARPRAHELRLASTTNLLDDFALTADLQGGQGGYIISCLATTVEVLAEL
ncbi:hypothetical protein BASA82_000645 [Batrachochytrium salamandrivorans]|nr:hypothetical protein BASA81_004121 [Batrachochytrium salamandrivorans]KAH9262304.1 hypothetical protein BASA82_000645 [Batrachochytrium salamandrivorans]